MAIDRNRAPGPALAYREYAVTLRDGSTGTIALTLGNLEIDTAAAQLARDHDALAYGLVSLMDLPDVPPYPVIWMIDWMDACVAVSGDYEIPAELENIIFLHIAVFLEEITPFAQQLSALQRIGQPATPLNAGDRRAPLGTQRLVWRRR